MKTILPQGTSERWYRKFGRYRDAAHQWLFKTPERSLDKAYQAASQIRMIEAEHFDGKVIELDSTNHGSSVAAYFKDELTKQLNIIRLRLAEFKVSRVALNQPNLNAELLEKLRLIDRVVDRYKALEETLEMVDVSAIAQPIQLRSLPNSPVVENQAPSSRAAKTGPLPRSIGRTIDRITAELKPGSEEAVIRRFHISRTRTRIAIRCLVVLIVVPILVQQLSKTWVIYPLMSRVQGEADSQIFLNAEMKEEALRELQTYEEELRFNSLLGAIPEISVGELDAQLHHKVTEIAEVFHSRSQEAISNVFADLAAVAAFAGVAIASKRQLIVLKSFMDDIAYGLSDSAKAFIIILLTDMFVGFHSPHGWEVLLEGLARHFGIVVNHSLIFLFIATVPVVMDAIFKYWIFRYLSRSSPSAVATLRNMNE